MTTLTDMRMTLQQQQEQSEHDFQIRQSERVRVLTEVCGEIEKRMGFNLDVGAPALRQLRDELKRWLKATQAPR